MLRALLLAVIGVLVVRIRRLERLRLHDAKTGVLTFASWELLAARELARARREARPVALLMLDIDQFKRINDDAGHQHGDAVLAAVGGCIGAVLRGYDVIGRFGGDEFVALIAGLNADDAQAVADRLRSQIAAECAVTVSIGVAWADVRDVVRDVVLDDLIARADAALYLAKGAGGDRATLADH